MTYGPLRLLVRALDRQVQPSLPGLDGFGAVASEIQKMRCVF